MTHETPDIRAVVGTSCGGWLNYRNPHRVFETHDVGRVLPLLREIESFTDDEGSEAIGFISYEAAPAFDPALGVYGIGDFPLIWFAFFREKETWTGLPESGESLESGVEWKAELSKFDYKDAVRRIKSRLAAGDTYQVNFTYRLRTPFRADPYTLFLRLHRNQTPKYSTFIQTGRFSVCSGSPELFFELRNRTLRCKPMKGTCARGFTVEQDREAAKNLSNAPKARAENVMIVDMVRNDLGRVADLGSVRVSELFEMEKYPKVWQMTSSVEARTGASVTDILRALFPCASVTGAPKPETMRIIRALEPSPRNVYTGAIGWIGPGRTARFNVAIRTACVDHKSGVAEFGTGGGIVWDSDAELEFKETLDKASILRGTWPDFQLLETLLWTPVEGYFLHERHLSRMHGSADYFDFPFPEAGIREALHGLVRKHPDAPLRIRILLARNGTFRLKKTPLKNAERRSPLRLQWCPFPVQRDSVFLFHKTTHREIYEKARAARPDSEDVILWNEKGEITETTVANLVIQADGKYWTPSVSCGLLGGVYRSWLLEQGEIAEKVLTKADLERCEAVWCVNSVRKWMKAVVTG